MATIGLVFLLLLMSASVLGRLGIWAVEALRVHRFLEPVLGSLEVPVTMALSQATRTQWHGTLAVTGAGTPQVRSPGSAHSSRVLGALAGKSQRLGV